MWIERVVTGPRRLVQKSLEAGPWQPGRQTLLSPPRILVGTLVLGDRYRPRTRLGDSSFPAWRLSILNRL